MKCYLLILILLLNLGCFSQQRVTIPWSLGLDITFGAGKKNPGPPLAAVSTDFIYTTDTCPAVGQYTIVNKAGCFSGAPEGDAGHFFFGVHPLPADSGYMMLANYHASTTSLTVFSDTVKNLCSNSHYLFWAGIRNLNNSACFYTNFSFIAETISGQLIADFQTGDIGAATDKGSPYFGYLAPDVRASFPHYYGGVFSLPAGTDEIILKIITNPTNAYTACTNTFAIDNILLTPVGPEINIADVNSDGWVTGTCFQNGKPITLATEIGSGYYDFSTTNFIHAEFNNPAFQWQQSIDDGYTWTDIAGETNLNLSHTFSIADTFYIRLRTSEDYYINNPNCSVLSNVIQVQVDGLPKDFDITSNSPVCTDSDIVLNVSGGATYLVTGPNGFYDNSSFPHVYHPVLADSGWYYAQIISFGGCVANDSTFVRVIGPNLKISVQDSAICYGQTTQLHSSGGNIYLWSPPSGLSNPNIPNPTANPVTTTKYQLKITDESKCSAYRTVTIRLRDSILKAQIIAPQIICPGDAVAFKDSSIGQVKSWYWSFGNGQTSNQKNPAEQHYQQLQNNLTYPVMLVATDSAGCADTTSVLVKAVNNCYIAVPSAFTPNHDGLNDYLYPLNAYKATNLLFIVYNRFGHVVFQTKDWTKKWDGTIAGMSQPAGTYVWILNYTDEKSTKISLKGTTVLIR